MAEPLLTVTQLTVRFHDKTAVDHVSLRVCRGDILTIIGPNGAGKTTLIKALLGLQPPTSGRVRRQPGW